MVKVSPSERLPIGIVVGGGLILTLALICIGILRRRSARKRRRVDPLSARMAGDQLPVASPNNTYNPDRPYPTPPPQSHLYQNGIYPYAPVEINSPSQTQPRQNHSGQSYHTHSRSPPVPPLLSFDAPKTEMENPCPICLAALEDEPVSSGQCLHLIHSSCLTGWLAKDPKSACPICRVPYQQQHPAYTTPIIQAPAS